MGSRRVTSGPVLEAALLHSCVGSETLGCLLTVAMNHEVRLQKHRILSAPSPSNLRPGSPSPRDLQGRGLQGFGPPPHLELHCALLLLRNLPQAFSSFPKSSSGVCGAVCTAETGHAQHTPQETADESSELHGLTQRDGQLELSPGTEEKASRSCYL